MSVHWPTDHVGYDGDFMHGHVKVNYWGPRAEFEAEMERQVALLREGFMSQRDELMADIDEDA